SSLRVVLVVVLFFVLVLPRPPSSPLFPYTTLFRSALDPVPLPGRLLPLPHPVECRPGRRVQPVAGLPVVEGQRQGGDHDVRIARSEEHTSELQSQSNLVCRLLLEKKNR